MGALPTAKAKVRSELSGNLTSSFHRFSHSRHKLCHFRAADFVIPSESQQPCCSRNHRGSIPQYKMSVLDQTPSSRGASIQSVETAPLNPAIVGKAPKAEGISRMTYTMTKPCPICKQQLTKQKPTDSVACACGNHVWQG
jgi:hypothetical protein